MDFLTSTPAGGGTQPTFGTAFNINVASDRTAGFVAIQLPASTSDASRHNVPALRIFDELARVALIGLAMSDVVRISQSVGAVSTTFGASSASGTDTEDATWRIQNERRITLILKETAEGLSEQETQELESLSTQAADYVNSRTPLPFAELDDFERRIAERLEPRQPQTG